MKTVVITGGAGGLGRALDNALQSRGWFTVLIDLPSPALDAIPPAKTRMVLACDLTDRSAMTELCQAIRTERPSIDLAIYNAGVTQIGPFPDLSETAHRKLFEINYFAAVNMAQELLLDLRTSKGTHLALSSVAGFAPLFHRTAYAASKHALEGFIKSLRAEEKRHGVRCVLAAPSFVATNLGNPDEQEGGIARPGSASDGLDYMSPKEAATEILKGLDKGKDFIPVGRVARLAYLINRLSPSLYARLMERQIKS